jgi:target of rapamycin complex subunit LST8
LEITPDRQRLAAAGLTIYHIPPNKSLNIFLGYQHIRMYELNSSNANPVVNCEGLTKNVTSVGFQEDGKWMFTGGEDCSARIWDLRKGSMQCQRIFQVSAPVNCVCLHPNQAELIVGDQSGIIHIWDLKTDHNEQLVHFFK